jgi:DNA-binding protein HU-beta
MKPKNGGDKMTKTELVAKVAEKAGLSKKDADKAANAFIDAIVETLASKEKVQLVGFGTFEVHHREERLGRNPRTKTEITIPASNYPVFKAGKSFKDAVSK